MKTEHGRKLAGRYVLDSPLASGGMAEVWSGRDEVLGRPVAVKILHEHLATDDEFLDRFRREAITAARLSHPCVVRVFDTGVDDGVVFIVMELYEGASLADRLRDGPLSPEEAARIARGILDGLAHAHRQKVVHRDVKPANVLLHGAQVKVSDFGIAKAAHGGDLTTTGQLLGTARYLAPEQVDAASVDHRADLYAMGIVLYEMLTGRTPFEAETAIAEATLRLTEDPRPPGALRGGIPRELEDVVMRALARDPDDRFQSAAEMREALDGAVWTAPPPAPPPSEEEPEPTPSFFRAWMLVPLAAVLLAAAVIVGGLLFGSLELGGPLGVRPRDDPGSPAAPAGGPLEVASVQAHDPEGTGGEHDDEATFAADGDQSTAWTTEGYTRPDLGGIKSGVGLIFDLGSPADVAGLEMATTAPGWTFRVFASGDLAPLVEPASFPRPLANENGETSFTAEETTTLAFPQARGRYVLIWITELTDVEGRFRALIAETEFTGG
ncbi:MAG TPA: protein kinase [Actinomycetota bacterium]